ncbi:class I SAM-dependent methyltransferase [Nonomuraea sp. NPDC050790]|uniref:class I SAM-dependent methyltransferase n=1 Tax=Nonomuraea sp. NPDC050790 TaxID=3364371 RepID=UPI0037A84B86
MTNRADAQSFDRIAQEYERLHELQGDNLGKWLPELLSAGGRRALDLGCGTGKHTLVLAERFAHVDAVDLSSPMIDLAQAKRARDNITYRQADLLNVGDMGHYDLVLSVATLHHVPDLRAALHHIETLVAPGGRAVLVDTVSPRPANPRWWLYGGAVRKLLRNLVRRNQAQAWEIFRLSTGAWLDHRVSDRYLSREQFERIYREVFPTARFRNVGPHAMIWDAPETADPAPRS